MANDATFIFKIIEQGGGAAGGAGTAAGKGGDPMASPQPSQRTQAREEAQTQAGGAQEIVQEAQRKNRDEKRKQPRPKPPKKEPFSPKEQAKLFGSAVAQRLGLGGVVSAIGTAALPLAAVTAFVGAGVAISKQQAALAQRLRPVSAELQVSQARERLRTISQDIDLSRRFGPQIAEAERQRGRLGAAAKEQLARISAGPVGTEVSQLQELAARLTENLGPVVDFLGRATLGLPGLITGQGPGTLLNRALDRFGISPDPFKDFTGNLPLFREFPHAEVKIFPKELEQRNLRRTGDAAAFTTNQDRILNQF